MHETTEFLAAAVRYGLLVSVAAIALGAPGPLGDGLQRRTAIALNELAAQMAAHGRNAEAEKLYKSAMDLCESGEDQTACDQAPRLRNNLGALYFEMGRFAEAEPILESAVRSWSGEGTLDAARAMGNLASVYRARARYGEAAALWEKAVAIRQAIEEDDPKLPAVLRNLALVYLDLGNRQRARAAITRAAAMLEKSERLDTEDGANVLAALGAVMQAEGDFRGAESTLRDAVVIQERLWGAADARVGETLNNLALSCRLQDRLAEAEPLYRRALEVFTAAGSQQQIAAATNNLGSVVFSQGRWKEARDLYTRALSIWEATLGPDHPEVAAALTNLAVLYQSRGKQAEAAALNQRAIDIDARAFPPDHPRIAGDLLNAASIAASRGRLSEAESMVSRSLMILEKRLPSTHADIGSARASLADLYRSERRFEESRQTYGKALEILINAWGPEDRRLLPILDRYALVLRRCEEYAEAAKVDVRAMKIRVVNTLRQSPGVSY